MTNFTKLYQTYIVERWCTKSSTNARAHFYFGQIRFARKVHRTNKERKT